MSGAGYDPKIIERFAEQLLRKADTVRVGCAVGGGIFGTFVGAVPLTPLKSVWGVPAGFGVATVIVGALLGVLIGYVIGEGRAFRYRVQAQSAIFQLEIERRVTSAVAEAVQQAAVAPAQAAHASAPSPAAPAVPDVPPLSPPTVAASMRAAEAPAADDPPAPPEELTVPPLTPVEMAIAEPLLRPPGAPALPVSPTTEPTELPPLSPAVNE
jgi:predicted lipid-binding transport protein (Tim44 family)